MTRRTKSLGPNGATKTGPCRVLALAGAAYVTADRRALVGLKQTLPCRVRSPLRSRGSGSISWLVPSGSRTKPSQNVQSAVTAQVDPCRGRRSAARSTPASLPGGTQHIMPPDPPRPLSTGRPLGVPLGVSRAARCRV
eukprot:812634-Prymnesium_polylepis.1